MKLFYEWNTPQLYAIESNTKCIHNPHWLSFTQICSMFITFPFILPDFELSLIVYYRCELRMVFGSDQQSTANSKVSVNSRHNDFK